MAYLFKVEKFKIFPNAETIMLEPFRTIWKRDKSKRKEEAKKEFLYIEFMSSYRETNPFRQYSQDKKETQIKKKIGLQDNWKPDKLVLEGIDYIHELQKEASTTYSYYLAAKTAAEKMEVFFNTVNINLKNTKTGALLYKPRDITSALNDTAKVLANIKELEVKVQEELYSSARVQSDKIISPFAKKQSFQ